MKKLYLSLLLLAVAMQMAAGVPEGYYLSADGKRYTELKQALKTIIANHTTFQYSNLWHYYPYTYYVISNPQQVLDMYSDDVTYFSNTSGLNKEHTVPKSWWGGSTSMGPGCDIFNVIPSEMKANSAKSNYPLGIVNGTVSFDNGVTKVGKCSMDGYSGNAFEPKDDYKGDFARIYFYVATCYPDLNWDSNNATAMTNGSALTLKSWIIPMLLEWNMMDPVDQNEIQRNEDIYVQQGNRNPFIDYPSLIDYIWGNSTQQEYFFAEHNANEGTTTDFPTLIPSFNIDFGTEDNPKKVVNGTIVNIKGGTSASVLYTRVNGGEWVETKPTTGWNSATNKEYHINATKDIAINGSTLIEAYCTLEGYQNSNVVKAYFEGVNFDDDFLLHEEFDGVTSGNNTSTSGSSAAWNGNENFPAVSSVYCAGNAIKMGSGKSAGSITSRPLTTTGGSILVEFDVKGWSTVEGKISVSLTGAPEQIVAYEATIDEDFEHIKLFFDNVSQSPVLKIATTAKRAFIDNVSVVNNDTNSIEKVESPDSHRQDNGKIYNLVGQPVTTGYHGIVICNGRKYILR